MEAASIDGLKSVITAEIARWSRVVQRAGIVGPE
jgi:hypothetical protein